MKKIVFHTERGLGIKSVVLDAGPLGMLAHPRASQGIVVWVEELRMQGVSILVPEIADYEVRRNLILEERAKSVTRLDLLKEHLTYLPITTGVMLKAAELWAEARKRGKPTADPHALDGDVILAAQTLQVGGIVATDNVGHLSLFVEAKPWEEIS